MRTLRWLALLLMPAISFAADPPADDGTLSVPLKVVRMPYAMSYRSVQLNSGKGEIPFPNGRGELKLEQRQGRLWVDSNGDGRINDKDNDRDVDPFQGSRVVKATALLGTRTAELLMANQGGTQNASLGYLSAWQGEIDGTYIRLLPGTVGKTLTFESIQISPDAEFKRARSERFGESLHFNEKLYTMQLADGGWTLKLTPYTGSTARVTIKVNEPANACDLTLTSVDQKHNPTLKAGEVGVCIPGEYRVSSMHLARNEKVGKDSMSAEKHTCIRGQHEKDADTITLAEGDNEIAVGGPFKLAFTATRVGDMVTVTDAWATGAGAVRYSASGTNSADQLFAAFLRIGGREQEITKLAYG